MKMYLQTATHNLVLYDIAVLRCGCHRSNTTRMKPILRDDADADAVMISWHQSSFVVTISLEIFVSQLTTQPSW